MFKLYTDGGARGNPGPSAIGFVLFDNDDVEVTRGNRYIGEATNNYAEYMAILAGLQAAGLHEATDLTCYLDSELVVKQLNGQYKMKNAGLKPVYDKVQELIKGFSNIKFVHVPRSENKIADKLVNEALDVQLSNSKL